MDPATPILPRDNSSVSDNYVEIKILVSDGLSYEYLLYDDNDFHSNLQWLCKSSNLVWANLLHSIPAKFVANCEKLELNFEENFDSTVFE